MRDTPDLTQRVATYLARYERREHDPDAEIAHFYRLIRDLEADRQATAAEIARLRASYDEAVREVSRIRPQQDVIALPDKHPLRVRAEKAESERDRLKATLRSIASNSCCAPCQEAKLVAAAALGGSHHE